MSTSLASPPATVTSAAVAAFHAALVDAGFATDKFVTEPLQRLAYGTDASFYRLVPQLVVNVDDEAEVQAVLAAARTHKVAITFRGAGTSLSGQSITDSVLVRLSDAWKKMQIRAQGDVLCALPGVRGGDANAALKSYARMIAPIPASIASATIGGITINNASGMNSLDTYGYLLGMRIVMIDGAVVDTGDPASRASFRQQRPELLATLAALSARVRAQPMLVEKIRRKYQLKNTTGYNLRALTEKDDPIDMLAGLMIGSEGTLGFLSEVTQKTIPLFPVTASALLLFPDLQAAGDAVTRMKLQGALVAAAELIDATALQAVAAAEGLPAGISALPRGTTALLTQIDADDEVALQNKIDALAGVLAGVPLVSPMAFSRDPKVIEQLWNVRKGVFPAVGATRPAGTTAIIEDVCFPVLRLTEALQDLRSLLDRHGYQGSVIYGHALDGNMHFIFAQGFSSAIELQRYRDLMEAVVTLVVDKYEGSLKAEHGTGRNMAPFVKTEWGDELYAVMREIKHACDPQNLLNPGVLINADPEIYLKNLKPIPAAHALVDRCIECGFCERLCPSRNLSFTPRQRIVAARERAASGEQQTWGEQRAFDWLAEQTCAGCGLCETVCPVGINTGDFIRQLRHDKHAGSEKAAAFVGEHFAGVTRAARMTFGALDATHRVLGAERMQGVTRVLRKWSGERLGVWTPSMPRAQRHLMAAPDAEPGLRAPVDSVVYFPSCAARVMGPARGDEADGVSEIALRLMRRAGIAVHVPENVAQLCCGMPFNSKGHFAEAERKRSELWSALESLTEGGRLPVLFDTSPCTMRMREVAATCFRVMEPAEFVMRQVVPRLPLVPLPEKIALHITCSSRRMGLETLLRDIAERCAREVVIPNDIACCGFAGDKGFTTPELNASALATLRAQVAGCSAGYSTSRTCEIGLSHHSGLVYRSLLHLVERASQTA